MPAATPTVHRAPQPVPPRPAPRQTPVALLRKTCPAPATLCHWAVMLAMGTAMPAGAQLQATGATTAPADAEGTRQAVPAPPAPALQPYGRVPHDALVERWRTERTPEAASAALAQLAAWRQAADLPADARARVASDLVTVASQSGDAAQAVAAARSLPLAELRPYALGAAVGAARATGDRALQAEAVAQWRRVAPKDWEPRVAEAMLQIDSGTLDAASASIERLAADPAAAQTARRIDLLELRGVLAEARGDRLGALGYYQQVLDLQPGQRYALRARVFLLADANAAAAAWRDAEALERTEAGRFSRLEMARLQQNALGQRLGWAAAERDHVEQGQPTVRRFDKLDAVIADLAAARTQFEAGPDAATPAWQVVRSGLWGDSVFALSERARAADTVALYEEAGRRGIAMPWYATGATALAWQQQRRSDRAVPLFEQAIRETGPALQGPTNLHVGLLYAYLDTGAFGPAETLMRQLEGTTPASLRLSPMGGASNPEYGDVQGLRALMSLYTDQPARAQQQFQALVGAAAYNEGFLVGRARTQRLREHPQAAAAQFEQILADRPDSVDGRAGYGETLLDLQEFGPALKLSQQLQAEYPESPAARSLARQVRAATGARLEIEAGAGEGGRALASREAQVRLRLSSGLIDERWRVFYEQVLGQATVGDDEGRTRRARGGIGLQYQQGRWDLEGQLHQSNGGTPRTGAAVGLRYRASDAWRLLARFDTNSPDVPWRAWRAGVLARETAVGARYIVDESREFRSELQRLDYRDGNGRTALTGSWRERWWSSPRLQFDSTLSADTARQETSAVPYFSPRRDASLMAEGRLQWLTWKGDDRVFSQVFEAGAGRYEQQGFGSAPVWLARYGHQWTLGPAMRVSYGLGVISHPYDGVSERRRQLFLNATFPLQ